MRGYLLVVAALGTLAGGCQFQFGGAKAKDVSPRNDAGLRPEKGFRKAPNKANTPEQTAVFAFLDDDKQRFQAATAGLTKKAKPSVVTAALTKYADQLDAADKAALPADFVTEVNVYRESYRGLVTVLARLPDGSYDGTKFYDSLAALFRNETEAGKVLGGDVVDAVSVTRTTGTELYKAAGQYSLDVDR